MILWKMYLSSEDTKKNFVYYIDKKDLNEVLLYLKKIKSEINDIESQDSFREIFKELSYDFKKNLKMTSLPMNI